MLTMFRKIGKLLRGGAGSREIFLGVFFGLVIGMIPGFNLTLVLFLLAALVLNANLGAALPVFALSKGLAFALSSLTFQVGYVIIHGIGLEGLFRSAAQTPVLALMDLQTYCLVGGVPVGILAGLIVGIIIARLATALRQGILEATKRSPKMEKLAQNVLVRLFLRLVFGKQKKGFENSLKTASPLLRKGGVILVAAALIISLTVEFFLLDYAVARGMKAGLEKMNGAEVNIESVRVSIFSARLQTRGIAITDREAPQYNALEIDDIEADLSIRDLLARRFVINRMVVDGLKFNTTRQEPGKILEPTKAKPPKTDKEEKPGKPLTEYFDLAEKYEKHILKVRDYLAKQREAVAEQESIPGKAELIEAARDDGFLKLSAEEFLVKHPLIHIREIGVTNIAMEQRFGTVGARGTNWSSHPQRISEPMTLELMTDLQGKSILFVKLNFQNPESAHHIECNPPPFALSTVVNVSNNLPFDVQDAQVQLAADGAFAVDSIDVGVKIAVTQLQIKPKPGKGILGMDPKTSAEVLQYLDHIQMHVRVLGGFDDLRVELDEDQLIKNLQKVLKEAGQEALAARVEQEINAAKEKAMARAEDEIRSALREKVGKTIDDKLKGETETQIARELEKQLGDGATGAVSDAIDSLLGGGKPKEDAGDEEKKEKKGGLLRSILGGEDKK